MRWHANHFLAGKSAIFGSTVSSHLHECYNLQGDGCQVERVHDKVHEVPPVVDVILEPTVPHLFDLCPDETCMREGE